MSDFSNENMQAYFRKFLIDLQNAIFRPDMFERVDPGKLPGNVDIVGALNIINNIVEILRPKCKFLPVYNRSFTTFLRSYYGESKEAVVDIPDEIIAFSIFSDEQGTFGGERPGNSPQAMSPRVLGYIDYMDQKMPVRMEPKDYLVDFIFFSKNDYDLLKLVDWFQVTMQTIIKPILQRAGVERLFHELTGDDEVFNEVVPSVRLPRSRYYIRVQRIYIDPKPVIDGFLLRVFSEDVNK